MLPALFIPLVSTRSSMHPSWSITTGMLRNGGKLFYFILLFFHIQPQKRESLSCRSLFLVCLRAFPFREEEARVDTTHIDLLTKVLKNYDWPRGRETKGTPPATHTLPQSRSKDR
jgi:hypothetical protein